MPTLGIIGGSGFHNFPGLKRVRHINIQTPYGKTPEPIVEGWLGQTRLLFDSRHKIGHRLLPSEVPYRAIIFALKKLGAECVIGISAVGSLRKRMRPGHLAVVRQYVDGTHDRPCTFFGNGIAGHVSLAEPTCACLAKIVCKAAKKLGIKIHKRAELKVMEGPAFSTKAEARIHRFLGIHLIGMTSLPEAKLAREAELCYITLALITDYDCWYNGEEEVNGEMVARRVHENVDKARRIIHLVAKLLPKKKLSCSCRTNLDTAIATDRKFIPLALKKKMQAIFGRVLSKK